jgi:hypothetical protein
MRTNDVAPLHPNVGREIPQSSRIVPRHNDTNAGGHTDRLLSVHRNKYQVRHTLDSPSSLNPAFLVHSREPVFQSTLYIALRLPFGY